MMRIKPEIFILDWSGTISNDAPPVYEANMAVLADYGKERMSFDEWRSYSAGNAMDFFREAGVSDDSSRLMRIYMDYYDHFMLNGFSPKPFPDAEHFIKALEKKKVALLSSHPEKFLLKEVDSYGFSNYFDFVIGGSHDKVEGLKDACGRFKTDPGQAIYVGDTVYDIRASKSANVVPAAVGHGYHTIERLAKERPEIISDSLAHMMAKYPEIFD